MILIMIWSKSGECCVDLIRHSDGVGRLWKIYPLHHHQTVHGRRFYHSEMDDLDPDPNFIALSDSQPQTDMKITPQRILKRTGHKDVLPSKYKD